MEIVVEIVETAAETVVIVAAIAETAVETVDIAPIAIVAMTGTVAITETVAIIEIAVTIETVVIAPVILVIIVVDFGHIIGPETGLVSALAPQAIAPFAGHQPLTAFIARATAPMATISAALCVSVSSSMDGIMATVRRLA